MDSEQQIGVQDTRPEPGRSRESLAPKRFDSAFRLVLVLIVLALAFETTLLHPAPGQLSHDEAISLLAMTGHERDYGVEEGELQSLARIHAFTELDPDRGALDVLKSLSERDVHPPLYFLSARAWLRLHSIAPSVAQKQQLMNRVDYALSVEIWLTRWSGLLVFLAAALLLAAGYFLPGTLGLGFIAGAAFFSVNYYVEAQAYNLRQYALLLFWSACILVLLVYRIRARPGRRLIYLDIALGLVGALGLLTQYLFGSVMLGVACALLLNHPHSWRSNLCSLARVAAVSSVIFMPWLVYARSAFSRTPGHLVDAGLGLMGTLHWLDIRVEQYWGRAPASWPEYTEPFLLLILVVFALTQKRVRAPAIVLAVCFAFPLAIDLFSSSNLLRSHNVAVAAIPISMVVLCFVILVLLRRAPRLAVVVLIIASAGFGLLHKGPDIHDRWVNAGRSLSAAMDAESGPSLVVINSPGRGDLLRRTRYLPSNADLVYYPGPSLAQELLHFGEYRHILLIRVARPCCGRRYPRLTRKNLRDVDDSLRLLGARPVKTRGKSIGGWTLYSRLPGG